MARFGGRAICGCGRRLPGEGPHRHARVARGFYSGPAVPYTERVERGLRREELVDFPPCMTRLFRARKKPGWPAPEIYGSRPAFVVVPGHDKGPGRARPGTCSDVAPGLLAPSCRHGAPRLRGTTRCVGVRRPRAVPPPRRCAAGRTKIRSASAQRDNSGLERGSPSAIPVPPFSSWKSVSYFRGRRASGRLLEAVLLGHRRGLRMGALCQSHSLAAGRRSSHVVREDD